jgi:hypothetical protein
MDNIESVDRWATMHHIDADVELCDEQDRREEGGPGEEICSILLSQVRYFHFY